MNLLILLGLLYFCCISPSFSESVRIPHPPLPPECDPPFSTKYECIDNSCTCGWCLSKDNHQTKKGHGPIGNCFIYLNHPEYVEKKCGSINSTVHTHVNSKPCNVKNIFIVSMFGVWCIAAFILCIIFCIVGSTRVCLSCMHEQHRRDVPISTVFDEL